MVRAIKSMEDVEFIQIMTFRCVQTELFEVLATVLWKLRNSSQLHSMDV